MMTITNAPGCSAFNPVERRMFHLSKQITGLILPAEQLGSHLSNGKTIDEELEKKNFQYAGEILCEVWNNLRIDNHEVFEEYISSSPKATLLSYKVDGKFKLNHLLETQYFTVVLKCDNRDCCAPYETAVLSYFPHRRIPALIPIQMTIQGPSPLPLTGDLHKQLLKFPSLSNRVILESSLVPADIKEKYNGNTPYDLYCPTLRDKIQDRICPHCGHYNGTKMTLREHIKICPSKPQTQPKNKKTVQRKKKTVKRKERPAKNFIISDTSSSESSEMDFVDDDSSEDEDFTENEEASYYNREDYDTSDPDSDFTDNDAPQRRNCSYLLNDIEVITDKREWMDNPWCEV